MIRNAPPKHPDSSKWYWLDWSADELQNATITGSTWTLPAGITKDAEIQSGYRVGIRLSGGALGEAYELLNQITTDSNETLHETLRITISNSGH